MGEIERVQRIAPAVQPTTAPARVHPDGQRKGRQPQRDPAMPIDVIELGLLAEQTEGEPTPIGSTDSYEQGLDLTA